MRERLHGSICKPVIAGCQVDTDPEKVSLYQDSPKLALNVATRRVWKLCPQLRAGNFRRGHVLRIVSNHEQQRHGARVRMQTFFGIEGNGNVIVLSGKFGDIQTEEVFGRIIA